MIKLMVVVFSLQTNVPTPMIHWFTDVQKACAYYDSQDTNWNFIEENDKPHQTEPQLFEVSESTVVAAECYIPAYPTPPWEISPSTSSVVKQEAKP